MNEIRSYQLTRETVEHLCFLEQLDSSGVLGDDVTQTLFEEGLKGLPEGAKEIMLPLDKDVYRELVKAVDMGTKIAVYKDIRGNRYVTVDDDITVASE